MARELGRIGDGIGKPARVDFLDDQGIDRSRKLGGQAHRFGGAFVGPRTSAASIAMRSSGSIAGGTRFVRVRGIERAADPLVELRDRRSESAAEAAARDPLARTNASVTVRTARLFGSRIRPDARPSGSDPNRAIKPAGERIRERAVGRDCIDRRASGAAIRHSAGRLPSRRSPSAFRHRTRAPGGRRRSSGRPRSPGPRGCSSRTAPRARLRAAPSRPSESP